MCIAIPGRVVAVDPPIAWVEADGERRRASLLVVPDVAVGDRVIVLAGTIVERLEPDEAARIEAELEAAMAVREQAG